MTLGFHFHRIFFCLLGPGVKELNLAATVEHLRDQRPNMVRTKVSQSVSWLFMKVVGSKLRNFPRLLALADLYSGNLHEEEGGWCLHRCNTCDQWKFMPFGKLVVF